MTNHPLAFPANHPSAVLEAPSNELLEEFDDLSKRWDRYVRQVIYEAGTHKNDESVSATKRVTRTAKQIELSPAVSISNGHSNGAAAETEEEPSKKKRRHPLSLETLNAIQERLENGEKPGEIAEAMASMGVTRQHVSNLKQRLRMNAGRQA
ncbi:MAG TPA: hypothetical protein VFN81_06670 [Sphingomicrobium sp.]|nr:hypothetical protein [Sphingomicrobium sp.]